MANSRPDRSTAPVSAAPAAPVRPAKSPARSIAPRAETLALKPSAISSRANEIVRAIGLRPITGLSGPKIGY